MALDKNDGKATANTVSRLGTYLKTFNWGAVFSYNYKSLAIKTPGMRSSARLSPESVREPLAQRKVAILECSGTQAGSGKLVQYVWHAVSQSWSGSLIARGLKLYLFLRIRSPSPLCMLHHSGNKEIAPACATIVHQLSAPT